ncbi:RES family NAD+ phosphorylase [Salmonella enterica subsp. enterica]
MPYKANQNDDANQSAENAVDIKTDKAVIHKFSHLSQQTLIRCSKTIPANTEVFRLQPGAHGGSSVFFNPNGADYRFSLTDGVHGSMYLAYVPKTSLKEVFQNKVSMKELDLGNYYLGKIAILKDVNVLQVNQLVSRTSIKIHDVTTGSRSVTQFLATIVHNAGFDGMEYLSNVTGETCLVLWHTDPAGKDMAITLEQTCLSNVEIEGKEAADILTWDLGISVEQ